MDHAESHMGETTSFKKVDNVNKSIFEVFSNLTNNVEVKRNESCIALVQHLTVAVDEESSGNVPKDVTYSIKRLVRGLGVRSQVAQKGYFTALVCVLESISVISCEAYMDTVTNEYCSKDASAEEGEALIGQVLAYGAAIRGGLFSRSSAEQQKDMIIMLMNCSKKKSYLPFASSSFLYDLVLNAEQSVIVDVVWPAVKEELLKPLEDQTLDSLLLLLSIFNRVPHVFKNKKIQQRLGFQVCSEESMLHFSQMLVGVNNAVPLKHPVYDELCRILCLPDNEPLLKAFWATDVDNQLVTPNKIKDHAVLHLLTILLNKLSSKRQVRFLVTPRILDVIGRTLSGSGDKKYLEVFSKAQEAITTLGNVLTSEDVSDKIRMSVLNKMLFRSGNLQYEKKTGTHIAVLLESKLGKKSVQELAKQFKDVADGNSSVDGQVWTNLDRKFAAQQLTRLIGHQACNDEISWKVDQLLFLFHRGVLREDSSSPVGVELAGTMRQCFFRALDQTFSNFKTMIEVLSQIVQNINGLLANKRTVKALRVPFSDKATASWQKMIKTVLSLEKKNDSNKNESAGQIFHSLFLFMGLQLFSDVELAVGALEELHSCYDRVKGGKRISKGAEEPHWAEVTIEVLLSLLSHDSHLLRTVVGTVFPHLSKHLTVSAFYQILEVLDPSQNENPLTSAKDLNNANDSDIESSSDEMEVTGTSKSNYTNGKVGHAAGNEDSSEEGSDAESENGDEDDEEEGEEEDDDGFEDIDDDDDDMDETVNDKFREELRQALGNAASLTDTESVDLDDVDEEEGQRLDKALSEAFKTLYQSRTSKKSKKQLKKEEGVTHFRNRVLDLVDLYISRDPSMELCLECITPLLSLLAFCMKDAHQKPLEMRTRSVLVKLTGLKKFSSVDGVDEGSLADQIKSLALKGAQSATTFLGLSDLISDCCTFLVRCSEFVRAHSKNQKPAKLNPVVNVYESLIMDFFTKRETLLPFNMFKSVISAHWSGCWSVTPLLVQHAFDSKMRPFRRGQAVDLLSIFFKNNRLLQSADDKQKQSLKAIVSSIVKHFTDLLNISNNDLSARAQSQQNKRFTTSVLRLVQQILSSPLTKPADVSSLSASLASFCQNCAGVSSETKRVLTTLSKQLKFNISAVKNLKRMENVQEVDASSCDEDENVKPTSKKKSSNDNNVNGFIGEDEKDTKQKNQNSVSKAKNKKAKKLQRMAMMGEGLDSVTFSDVSDKVLNGMEPADEEMDDDLPSNYGSHVNGFVKSTATSSAKRQPECSSADDSQGDRKRKKRN